jgi:hypothetical protein
VLAITPEKTFENSGSFHREGMLRLRKTYAPDERFRMRPFSGKRGTSDRRLTAARRFCRRQRPMSS